ncbi:MAG: peptide-methionine (S)-S-oxide reductase MsrA [Pontiellaceae bacterium]|nr:peptide-methionine (S)-S-oxide reductase MsrA [Pontiellaceae bacterium]
MKTLMLVAALSVVSFCAPEKEPARKDEEESSEHPSLEKAIFAGGCFWGVEALFQELDGVVDTTVGYTGGFVKNPTYSQVCSHATGHAEAVEVIYDSKTVSYAELLKYFWRLHDPTTVDRQGPDIGNQYRSAIFYLTPEQKEMAEIVKPEAQKRWKKPIVTEIVPASTFYPAEAYHQDYFSINGGHGCHFLRD